MKDFINELNKYIEIDEVIKDICLFLKTNNNRKLSISEIEDLLNSLNIFLLKIKTIDQISTKKKNKILNILNEIILSYNELLMDEICKKL